MTKSAKIEHGRAVKDHFDRSMDQLERDHGGVPREQMSGLFQILATSDLLHRFMSAAVASHGLSFAGFRVLATVSKETGRRVPMHRLSEWLSVSRQNVTGLVDGLEKRGLVRRSTCGNDRRVKWVELTDGGIALLGVISPRQFTAVRALFGGLGPADLTELTRLLTNVRERILTLGPEMEPGFSLDQLFSPLSPCGGGGGDESDPGVPSSDADDE